jgi:hypothetical protein
MMGTYKNLEFNEEYIECKIDLPLAILRIKENAFFDKELEEYILKEAARYTQC